LCPSHLAHQWEAEAKKAPQLKVVVVTTIAQHRKYTYAEFIDSDLVVVSYQFLQNQNYFYLGAATAGKSVKKGTEVDRTVWVDKHLNVSEILVKSPLAKSRLGYQSEKRLARLAFTNPRAFLLAPNCAGRRSRVLG